VWIVSLQDYLSVGEEGKNTWKGFLPKTKCDVTVGSFAVKPRVAKPCFHATLRSWGTRIHISITMSGLVSFSLRRWRASGFAVGHKGMGKWEAFVGGAPEERQCGTGLFPISTELMLRNLIYRGTIPPVTISQPSCS